MVAAGAGLAVVVLAVVLLSGGREERGRPAEAPAASAKAKAEAEKAALRKQRLRLARAKEALRKVQAEEQANPRAYAYVRALYARLIDRYGDIPSFAEQVKEKLRTLENLHIQEGRATLEDLESKVQELSRTEGGYGEALQLFTSMPPELEGIAEFEERYEELGSTVRTLARQERYLSELKNEAMAYARKGRYRVASLIVELGFSENDFRDTPLWERRDKLIEEFKAAPLAKVLEAERALEEEKKRKAAEQRKKELAAREKAFVAAKERVPAEPLLGPYDLINWPIRSWGKKWDLGEENGKGVLTVSAEAGKGNWWLGPNGSHWEDYAVTFRIRVKAGSVLFYPRVEPGGVPALWRRRVSPDLSRLKPALTFTAESTGGKWVEVHVDVYGGGDEAVIHYEVRRNGSTETKRLRGSELKGGGAEEYLDHGSFLFVFEEGCEAQLKEVFLKLIRHKRHGILD